MSGVRAIALGAAACAAVLLSAGCGSSRSADRGADGAAGLPTAQPGDRGLLVRVLTVDDTDDHAGRALASLVDPPADARRDSFSDGLRANGLWGVRVPEAVLEDLVAMLPEVGPSRSDWLGEPTSWTPVVAGEPFRSASMGTDAGAADLPAGVLALQVRGWAVRSGEGGPRMRLEVVPAFYPSGARVVWFERMFSEIELEAGEALVLVAASPLVDWWTLPPPDPERSRGVSSFDASALRRSIGLGLRDAAAGPNPDADPAAAPNGSGPGGSGPDGSGSGGSGSGGSGSGAVVASGGVGEGTGPVGPELPRLRSVGDLLLERPQAGLSTSDAAAVVMIVPRLGVGR